MNRNLMSRSNIVTDCGIRIIRFLYGSSGEQALQSIRKHTGLWPASIRKTMVVLKKIGYVYSRLGVKPEATAMQPQHSLLKFGMIYSLTDAGKQAENIN